ncbi:hypothetical protein AKJ09_00160 [Labilithrix luteola]|uniref:Uncharacterized protein n=1 Tax=Labilithrix luteola TaxID=1391654 RepID=A0A0K1PJB7_9BACT|nr:hypothetical protein [Labilithrix luteola]AKU93496.1 hypothetical protein AKJ09_00160 [Labilithrix luteola]
MAYLNVRERRVEAKVAYVGGERSGKRSALVELRKRSGLTSALAGADAFAFDLRPRKNGGDDDYPLIVKLVAHEGAPEIANVAPLLSDADAVVVVIDVDPSAHDENRQAVQVVRDVLGDRTVPVHLHVVQSELSEFVTADAVVAELGVTAWPHAATSSSPGDGAYETFNRVVHDVMEAMTQSDVSESETQPVPHAARGEGNPLLSALRRVLDTTVEQHVRRLGEELTTRIESSLDARVQALAARIDLMERGGSTASVERQIESVRDRIEAIEDGAKVFRHQMVTNSDELLRAARHTCTREDLATISTDLRDEVVRSVDASVVASRESVASITGLRRAIDGLTAEARRASTKEAVSAISTKLEEMEQQTMALGAVVERASAPAITLAGKVADSKEELVRELRENVTRRIASLDAVLREVAARTETAASVDERTARVETLLTELIEELKKPKKGWFG